MRTACCLLTWPRFLRITGPTPLLSSTSIAPAGASTALHCARGAATASAASPTTTLCWRARADARQGIFAGPTGHGVLGSQPRSVTDEAGSSGFGLFQRGSFGRHHTAHFLARFGGNCCFGGNTDGCAVGLSGGVDRQVHRGFSGGRRPGYRRPRDRRPAGCAVEGAHRG